jgi:DNA-binding response OmpR family regulator
MTKLTTGRKDRDTMKRILVVDDEDAIRRLYAEELRNEGYDVITTGEGKGLVEMIKKHKPDLVLLDIKMGVYDGLDLLQDVRNAHYNLPVILCSAYGSFKYDIKSIAADYYVVKSIDMSELKEQIHMALDTTSIATTGNHQGHRKSGQHLSRRTE